jgi:Uma2 family endonuclease
VVAPKHPGTESVLTLDEFLRLPDTKPASEYADGKVIQKVSPRAKHSRLQYMLCQHINRTLNPAHYAFPELRCTFGGRSLVPDVAVLRLDRLPRDESGEVADDILVAPDAAIEIRSPRQAAIDLVEKLAFSVQHGVRLGLLIDPDTHRVIAFRAGDYPEEIPADGVMTGGDLLPGLDLALPELWSWLAIPTA